MVASCFMTALVLLAIATPAIYGASASDSLESLKEELRQLQSRIEHLEKTKKTFPNVKYYPSNERKRILVTGGAGFVGSHLVDRLMMEGNRVTVIDNFFTGSRHNVEHWIGHPHFEMIQHDVVNPFFIEVDQIYHLASPASPPHYMFNRIKTIKTNTVGTINMLGLARRVKARLLFTSTSEVYGDPQVHPQSEDYWGNVNPIGPRACYDEAKRVAEAMCYAYMEQENIEIRIARIFNTYGPRMNLQDGRVVSNFITQSLQHKNLTIYGDGSHTRSFQYVDDLVNGLVLLMNSNYSLPVNLGNPDEYTMKEFATLVRDKIGNGNELVVKEKVTDDPTRRRPDITRAKRELNWSPTVKLDEGLDKTIAYFRAELNEKSSSGSSQQANEEGLDEKRDIKVEL